MIISWHRVVIKEKKNIQNRFFVKCSISCPLNLIISSFPSMRWAKPRFNIYCDIGHMKDPDALPGLAHFCEHMLFLGTKKVLIDVRIV